MNRLDAVALAALSLAAASLLVGPALAQSEPASQNGHDMAGMDMSGMAGMNHGPRAGSEAPAPTTPAAPHAGHDMSSMPGMDMAGMDMPGMDMSGGAHAMAGALGPYAATREASGTAWQPEASAHDGLHLMRGAWMVMLHGTLNGVLDRQIGRRGDDMSFASGMLMGMAQRDLGGGDTVQLRGMFSPDPAMGKRGYPLLLAAGETADGRTPIVDRQHPHDLVMELSASFSHRLSGSDSVFVYAGLPGEPAFGPPAFMHRASIADSPEAPVSHHWLDSTHITFGVVTAGYVHGDWKLEASRFRGREPDQHRYDIETGALDSTALRLSWNPSENWSLQSSWAHVTSPEQLEPDLDQTRLSASAIYTIPFGDGGRWSTTAAWGRRTAGHEDLDAWTLESALRPNAAWTVFARAEQVDTDELTTVRGHHGPVYRVAKVSAGAVRDWNVADHMSFGLGALYATDRVPDGLKAVYGSNPSGSMLFARIRLR
jgi:hypothetical protein